MTSGVGAYVTSVHDQVIYCARKSLSSVTRPVKFQLKPYLRAALLKELRKRESSLHVPVYVFSQCLS